MLKSIVVILAMFLSVAAQAKGYDYYAIQDQKAVGVIYRGTYDAVVDQKAAGAATNPLYQGAVQDQKAAGGFGRVTAVQDQKSVSLDSQIETAKLIDLNEGF